MWEARSQRIARLGRHGDLTAEEQHILEALFYLRNQAKTREVVERLLRRPPPAGQASMMSFVLKQACWQRARPYLQHMRILNTATHCD